jgi:hypothetical protein
LSVSQPPANGPTIEERPNTPPKTPCIRARWAGEYTSASTVKTDANSIPPKSPWAPRKKISEFMSQLAPQSQLKAMKPIIPASRKGLRPKRSPSLPAIGVMTVDVTR